MKNLKRQTLGIVFVSSILLMPFCKSSYTLTDDIKSIVQNMSPEEAAVKLNSIMENDKSGAAFGLDEIVTGGSTIVRKDSITYHKRIGAQTGKSSPNFATGYETVPAYNETTDMIVSVQFNKVKTIKIQELKNGNLRITIKDDNQFIITRPMYQFETQGTNSKLVIALCSKLMPDAKIVYSGSPD
jgi:hypothetical protein